MSEKGNDAKQPATVTNIAPPAEGALSNRAERGCAPPPPPPKPQA